MPLVMIRITGYIQEKAYNKLAKMRKLGDG